MSHYVPCWDNAQQSGINPSRLDSLGRPCYPMHQIVSWTIAPDTALPVRRSARTSPSLSPAHPKVCYAGPWESKPRASVLEYISSVMNHSHVAISTKALDGQIAQQDFIFTEHRTTHARRQLVHESRLFAGRMALGSDSRVRRQPTALSCSMQHCAYRWKQHRMHIILLRLVAVTRPRSQKQKGRVVASVMSIVCGAGVPFCF